MFLIDLLFKSSKGKMIGKTIVDYVCAKENMMVTSVLTYMISVKEGWYVLVGQLGNFF